MADGTVEVYDSGRYFTVTGRLLAPERSQIVPAQHGIEQIIDRAFGESTEPEPAGETQEEPSTPKAEVSDHELLDRMFASRNGGRIAALWHGNTSAYPSQSEADLALCSHLWFWTGGDLARVDALFRTSGLMRPKWDRDDYRASTLAMAAQGQNLRQKSFPKASPSPSSCDGNEAMALRVLTAEDQPTQETTHRANAWRITRRLRAQLRFVEGLGFLVYDGKRWLRSETEALRVAARVSQVIADEIRGLQREAAGCNSDQRKRIETRIEKLIRWQRQSENTPTLRESLKLAAPLLRLEPPFLDAHPTLLNVENGTLDLATGELQPHRQEDFLTRLAPVEYQPEAQAPRWRDFIDQVSCGNERLARYLQTALGYSITGLVREQCLFFAHGQGQNGKSTLLDVLRTTLGSDYITKAAPNLLISSPQDRPHPSEIADLRGARLVICQETALGKAFDLQKLKELTGEQSLKAREMYGSWFEFDVTFKIWMAANHLPSVHDSGLAFWRRFHLVPFTATIENPIRDFGNQLREERTGILTWLVEGSRRYLAEGLEVPDEVTKAVEGFRSDCDSLGQFLDEACEQDETAEVRARDLWEAYESFCEEGCLAKTPQRALRGELERRGLHRLPRRKQGFFYSGLRLRADGPGPIDLSP